MIIYVKNYLFLIKIQCCVSFLYDGAKWGMAQKPLNILIVVPLHLGFLLKCIYVLRHKGIYDVKSMYLMIFILSLYKGLIMIHYVK